MVKFKDVVDFSAKTGKFCCFTVLVRVSVNEVFLTLHQHQQDEYSGAGDEMTADDEQKQLVWKCCIKSSILWLLTAWTPYTTVCCRTGY